MRITNQKFPALTDIYNTTPRLKTAGALWKKGRKTARPKGLGSLLGDHVSYVGQGSCPKRSQTIWQPKVMIPPCQCRMRKSYKVSDLDEKK